MYARDEALIATPIGGVRVIANGDRIIAIRIEPGTQGDIAPTSEPLRLAAEQLRQWFAGERQQFDLPLAPAATPRGKALRDGMIGIGYGDTLSYGALSRQLASSARAMGQACARNPFPIVVPCHRVLNADGSLGAYSGGDGPITKQWLLDHEQRHRSRSAT
ncbi:methylated-DNA--[protein]-cysteine S-methyltransferase [Sphingomonas sp. AR_OL41]|uniref:methylated-DNA--[protein]-cysteine S-methyltransferase n=1 Tax=Sphingomonas sp. AR_OL41 TaxID=3042729 RepID=UPI0024804636|nr:methylated-DNA--[protein]-cysteine S-methyltransferase [Sphingomonas sp. AR_OL41]MDH7973827.1 methylated-DNA--[protein]-cysteine S-methyltransferase [Sphingomonas sp. AR_OL41]